VSVILFLVILLVLVLVHEFGHFIVAKKSGIRVDEFGFGFPPKLFGVKKGETIYSFNALPFGGFVKIFGENPDEENTKGADANRSLVNKPKRIQALVLVAGVVFNILLAWFLFSASFMFGMPVSADSILASKLKDANLVITSVLKDSPAQMAGIEIGDKVIGLGDSALQLEDLSVSSVQNFISSHGDRNINMKIRRNGDDKEINLIPKEGIVEGKFGIGVSLDIVGILKLPVHKALWEGAKTTGKTFVGTIAALAKLVKDSFVGQADLSSITGPVGIVGVVGDAYKFGIIYLLSFTALISINLAVINLVPFPALDGGRLLFLAIEKIKGSRIKPSIANAINAIGFILLIILMIVVTYNDIARLIR